VVEWQGKVENLKTAEEVEKQMSSALSKSEPRSKEKEEKEENLGHKKQKLKENSPKDDEKEKHRGLKPELKGAKKCRFFPCCRDQTTCPFFHPTDKVLFL
jgi:hypothetical protein